MAASGDFQKSLHKNGETFSESFQSFLTVCHARSDFYMSENQVDIDIFL